MTFDQLEAFEMIIEKGSFKAAAAALHKTQPTLSISIKKLEEEFDLLLFNRDEYRPRLTDQGQVFYNWAKHCLRSFRELSTVGKELGTLNIEPSLLIVVDPLTPFSAIEGIFQECLTKSVPTELTLRSEILEAGMTFLIEGKADFAIAPRLSRNKDIESIPFETIDLVPCIAAAKGSLEPADSDDPSWLENHTQIVVRSLSKESSMGPNKTAENFGVLERGKKCFVTDHTMKRRLILEGFGWGRLAQHEIEDDLRKGKLLRLDHHGLEALSIELHLMRNTLRPMGPVARSIWESLSQHTPSTGKAIL